MTGRAAICKSLLLGKTVNIKVGFAWFGITNMPREIGGIERKFGIKFIRKKREGLTRYKIACHWMDYRLKIGDENKAEVLKMIEYVIRKEGEVLTAERAVERNTLNSIVDYIKRT